MNNVDMSALCRVIDEEVKIKNEALRRAKEHDAKIKDAALRMLGIAEELHLSWADFEEVLKVFKKRAILSAGIKE